MATRTSVGSGAWGTAGTWDTGVPENNDVVVIAAGHVVEFNVDQSGFADGIDGLTITGTLSLTRTAGTYYLKIKAAKTIAVAGVFDCGTEASIIPFTAKHTITGGAGWYINGASGGTMTVYAAEPSIKTILLSGDEAIGQTELSVDTDITSDIWADGDTIRIDDINKAAESEERVIATGGRASGAITVTAGLTAAKSTGAVVSLISRNVKFIAVGTAGYVAQSFQSGKLTIAGGQFYSANTYRLFTGCTGMSVSGGAFTTSTIGFYNNASLSISGGVFSGHACVVAAGSGSITGGSFSGNGAVLSGVGYTISGITAKGNGAIVSNYAVQPAAITAINGTYTGNGNCYNSVAGINIFGGTYNNNTSVLNSSAGKIINAIFVGNTQDINNSHATMINTEMSSTEFTNYTSLPKEFYNESIDHDGSAGAYKAWTKGGVTTSQASVLPSGYTKGYITVLENATVEGYWQREITVLAGEKVNIEMQLRKAVSMTYLPRCHVFLPTEDPFASGTPEHTFTMTDSTDTWESDTYTVDNSAGTEDIEIIIRFQGMNATGNMYSALSVTEEGGGGGAVSIRPITGTVQL